MNSIPQDPIILFSWTNLKLRDYYKNLDELCEDLEIDKAGLIGKLAAAGFEYDDKQNRFR